MLLMGRFGEDADEDRQLRAERSSDAPETKRKGGVGIVVHAKQRADAERGEAERGGQFRGSTTAAERSAYCRNRR